MFYKDTSKLTFAELKKMNYPEWMTVDKVIEDLMINQLISFEDIVTAHVNTINDKLDTEHCKLVESGTSILQLLSKNFKTTEERKQVTDRAIHALNGIGIFPAVMDAEYDYTEKDKEYWDKFYEQTYGRKL